MASLHGLYIVNSTLETLGGVWKEDKILMGVCCIRQQILIQSNAYDERFV